MIARIAEAFKVDTILSYCHGNLLSRDFIPTIEELAERDGLGLINASITHMGVLSPQGQRDWHPAPQEVFDAGARVRAVCDAHGRDVAQVALCYALNYAGPHSTLIGVANEEQLASSLGATEQEIPEELQARIDDAIGGALDLRWHDGLPENFD
jgi:aryl-alcohol dehydrogenase-like predicted oxidoreductase